MKIIGRILLALVAILLLVVLLLQTELFQNLIVKKVTKQLSDNLHTEIRIQHVSFSFFNRMNLEEVLVRDQKKDTLLYAGTFKLRITDWFFLKKNIDIKYVGLENAVVKIDRKDSVWNYQFLMDYFASPKKEKKASRPLNLDLQKIDFDNVTLSKTDHWNGQNINLHIGSLVVDARKVDFAKSIFNIRYIDIDKLSFVLYDYHALKPKKDRPYYDPKSGEMYFNEMGITVHADSVRISNSDVSLLKELKNRGVRKELDTRHLVFTKLNINAKKFDFNKDTITARINLHGQERSGLDVRHLKADFRLTPQMMQFKHFDLQTAKSRFHDYLAFHFHDFNKDFADFESHVGLDAHFVQSETHTDDIAFIEPSLKSWNKHIRFSLDLQGVVYDFVLKNALIKMDEHSYISGDLAIKGFPEFDTAHMNLQHLTVQTTRAEAAPVAPILGRIKNPDFDAMGVMLYRGNFVGTVHDFFTEGNFSTAIGSLYTKAHLTFPDKGEPRYQGSITTRQFNIGKFVHSDAVGEVDFNGTFNGTSYELSTAKSSLKGHFNQIDVNSYRYSDVDVNGTIQKKYFTGMLNINDSNAHVLSNIQVDFNGNAPKFNIIGDLQQVALQKLHFTKDNFLLTGLFDLDFEGNNIDDYIGTAKVLNATFAKDSLSVDFDSLAVKATNLGNDRKRLSVESNEFNINLEGKYNVLDLPNSFQTFLNKYYPSLIAEPKHIPRGQNFLLTVNTKDFSPYLRLFLPHFSGLDSAVVTGGINTTDANTFYLHANIPNLNINERIRIRQADIEGRGDLSRLALTGKVDSIYTKDSFWFPNTELDISSAQDHSVVQLRTRANKTLNDASLQADVNTLSDGVKINFRPSSFVLNEKKWLLEKEGEIVIRKNIASAQNVKFKQGIQELEVETSNTSSANVKNELVVRLKNIDMGDFMPLVVQRPQMDGIANGTVRMQDFFGEFNLLASIDATQFRLNDDSVGVVHVNGNFDKKTQQVKYNVISDNEHYRFNIGGSYDIAHLDAPLDAYIHLSDARIFILNEWLGTLFSDVTGQSTGELHLKGSFDKPVIVGNVQVRNSGLTVNYTQVHYKIDSANIQFLDDRIDLGNIVLKDQYGNQGIATGTIYENALEDMRYDVRVTTDKLLALNTVAKDNPSFYGTAVAKGQFLITGPQSNIQMYVNATAADSSNIVIPTSGSRESSDADYIIFKQYGSVAKKTETNGNRMSVDLDLNANGLALIEVIMDQQTGDAIRARGNGRLAIHIPADGAMTMKGRYTIERGRYDFSFQSLIKKPFDLIGGQSNYIEWTGSPYNADMHVAARYTASHVNMNDLMSSQMGANVTNGNMRGYRGEVYVLANLTGKLSHPDISFGLDFPIGSSVKNDPDFALFLNRLESDNNEMLKQVTYLIVFGTFAPYGTGGSATSFASVGVNSISGIITNELNHIVSDVLFKLTGNRNLQFDVSTSTYSSAALGITGTTSATNTNRLDRQAVNVKLSQSLLNGNVIVNVGSDLDFGLGGVSTSASGGSFQWLPDISVSIILSRDRTLRAIVFNRSSLDVGTGTSLGRRNRMGASLSYSKDFEHFFGKKSKIMRVRTDTVPADTSSGK
ncbi:MAG: translocation/assembly module TamB domain-containing protein [Chitinophagaceae bacterium]